MFIPNENQVRSASNAGIQKQWTLDDLLKSWPKPPILSDLEVKIAYSDFSLLFLIKDARISSRRLNAHINQITRDYLQGQFREQGEGVQPSPTDASLLIRVEQEVLDLFLDDSPKHIEHEMNAAIYAYFGTFIFSEDPLNPHRSVLKKQIYTEIAALHAQSNELYKQEQTHENV